MSIYDDILSSDDDEPFEFCYFAKNDIFNNKGCCENSKESKPNDERELYEFRKSDEYIKKKVIEILNSIISELINV